MIFGLFSKKKNYNFTCPICSRPYQLKLNPEDFTDFDYQYREEAAVIDTIKCGFCKMTMTLVIFKSGMVKAYDVAWEKIKAAHNKQIDALSDDVDRLFIDEEESGTENKNSDKIKAIETKIEKLEDAFSDKEYKYSERQGRRREKYEDKFG